MILIGIDTGSKGAIAEIDTSEKLVRWMKLPYREDGILLARNVHNAFDFNHAHKIAVEEVGYIKNANGNATFKFGQNYGLALALVAEYPFELIRPQVWHKRLNGPKTDDTSTTKKRSKATFQRMNPSFGKIVAEHHEGMIDAFLIGYFCGLKNFVIMGSDYNFMNVD